MRIAAGVRILGMKPEIWVGLNIADGIYLRRTGADALLTSGIEGSHSRGSQHYKGLAGDLRTRDIDPALLPSLVAEIKAACGSDFDVVLETAPPHLHLEFDPKEPIK